METPIKTFLVRKRYLYLVILLLLASVNFHVLAQYRIVTDPYALKAVVQNTMSQKLVEDAHNKRLDSIASKKQKIEQFTTTMAVISEAYQVTMQNIKGFGTESKYYVEIGLCSYEIVQRFPKLYSAISKSKIPGQTQCLLELTNLYGKTEQLVQDFVNIVNNAKVTSPLKTNSSSKTKSDGYNFLDRYDRLTVANKILTDLNQIRYKLEYLEMVAQYASWGTLWQKIDPQSWSSVMAGKNRVDMIVSMWKNL